jgi:hypothetical protein
MVMFVAKLVRPTPSAVEMIKSTCPSPKTMSGDPSARTKLAYVMWAVSGSTIGRPVELSITDNKLLPIVLVRDVSTSPDFIVSTGSTPTVRRRVSVLPNVEEDADKYDALRVRIWAALFLTEVKIWLPATG